MITWWEWRKLQENFAALRSAQSSAGARRVALEDRVESLESENGHLKLCLAATMNLLIQKGVVTKEEMLEIARSLDVLDGKEDGKLPGVLSPDGTVAPPPPPLVDKKLEGLAEAVRQQKHTP
jgi:hypothetical protein